MSTAGDELKRLKEELVNSGIDYRTTGAKYRIPESKEFEIQIENGEITIDATRPSQRLEPERGITLQLFYVDGVVEGVDNYKFEECSILLDCDFAQKKLTVSIDDLYDQNDIAQASILRTRISELAKRLSYKILA